MAGVRRTWDKNEFEAKAKLRAEMGDIPDSKSGKDTVVKTTKEEFLPAPEDTAGPMGSERAFLKARETRIDLDSKVGKTQVVTPSETEGAAAPGWWCEDSTSYLDHINGKKHQRALGYSMRVERAGVDKVKNRMDMLKRKIREEQRAPKTTAVQDYETRLASQAADDEFRKKKRVDEKAAKKQEQEIAEMESGIDPEIATLMGFGGFGSKK